MTVLEKILMELQNLNSKIEKIETSESNNYPKLLNGKANLNSTEAIELLGIGRNKLLELVHSNAIPHIANGSKYLFPVDQLFNWIKYKASENYKTKEAADIDKVFKSIS